MTAAMNLDQLQQARGAYGELLVGLLERSLPALVFPLVGSPTHPFRLCRRCVPAAPSFAAKLAVQFCGASLKPTKSIFALAGISEAVGLVAPEMPATIRQKKLGCAAAGSRAQKPPGRPP
jgi:hypothetical protein